MPTPATTAAGRYQTLSDVRDQYLDRAREAALLTIPSLMPPEGFAPGQKLYTPFQSVGARGVNNLASRLLMTLLPPNAPCFRQVVDPAAADKMKTDDQFKTKVEAALSKFEKIVQSDIEESADRVPLFEALKHLIAAGNVLVYLPKDEGMKVFHLDRYVVKRDRSGNALEIITKECVAIVSLPKAIRDVVADEEKRSNPTNDTNEVDVYTHIRRTESAWMVHQEVQGRVIPGTHGQYPLDRSPWLPLRMIRIDGEDYGRGYVEEYLGDLQSLEGLSKAIVEATAAAAKVLFLVKPNGTTDPAVLQKAPNLAIRSGNAEDVTVIQMQKYADLQVARGTAEGIEARLEQAFLLATSVQRDAERVTAEEIRLMAAQLEESLGGVYSLLSLEFQKPYIERKIAVLTKSGRLPRLPKTLVRTAIVTGIEALGRGQDKQRLVSFLSTAANVVGPQNLPRYVNLDNALMRLAASDGIDTEGLIVDPKLREQTDQQTQMQQLLQNLSPEIVKQIGGMMQKGMTPNGGNAEATQGPAQG